MTVRRRSIRKDHRNQCSLRYAICREPWHCVKSHHLLVAKKQLLAYTPAFLCTLYSARLAARKSIVLLLGAYSYSVGDVQCLIAIQASCPFIYSFLLKSNYYPRPLPSCVCVSKYAAGTRLARPLRRRCGACTPAKGSTVRCSQLPLSVCKWHQRLRSTRGEVGCAVSSLPSPQELGGEGRGGDGPSGWAESVAVTMYTGEPLCFRGVRNIR